MQESTPLKCTHYFVISRKLSTKKTIVSVCINRCGTQRWRTRPEVLFVNYLKNGSK